LSFWKAFFGDFCGFSADFRFSRKICVFEHLKWIFRAEIREKKNQSSTEISGGNDVAYPEKPVELYVLLIVETLKFRQRHRKSCHEPAIHFKFELERPRGGWDIAFLISESALRYDCALRSATMARHPRYVQFPSENIVRPQRCSVSLWKSGVFQQNVKNIWLKSGPKNVSKLKSGWNIWCSIHQTWKI